MSPLITTQRRILGLLLLSGFCALTYEILWAKHLTLTLGSSINAISIVTATFMVGLSLGSYFFGRYADRTSSPLRLYALLEAGILFFALTFPWMLKFSEQFYVALHHQLPDWPGAVTTIRLLIAALMVLPPTILMGGTLPAIARFHAPKEFTATISRMYAVNTLGGVLGCFLGGFFLIPNLGLSGTNHFALSINLLLVGTALYLAKKSLPQQKSARAPISEMPIDAPPLRLALPFIAVAGGLSLALEILWTRLLILMLGNTTYAFSSILSVFLLGLAVGGWIYTKLLKRQVAPRAIYFWCLLLASIYILGTHTHYDKLAYLFLLAHQFADGHWWLLSQLNLAVVTLVLLPPTVAFGTIFPAGMALIAPHTSGSSHAVGLALFTNTIGTVIGSLAAGFLLLPLFGLHDSFHICLSIAFIASLSFLLSLRPVTNRLALSSCAVALVGLVFVPGHWEPSLMNSGVYVYAPYYTHNGGIAQAAQDYKIIEVVEGKETTVAVTVDKSGTKTFRVNGKTDGSNGSDMLNQVLAAQIPLLLHPDPETTLVIGLGTGITLGETLTHPVKQADCIEISPGVVAISDHFTQDNYDALKNTRANVQVMDGRNYLLTSQKQYDVIISEPSNPWQSGNANLFTYEFYELVKQSLNPGGVFCQWIPMYDLNPEKLGVAFKTFAKQFDEVRVFRIGPEVIMIGSNIPIEFDYDLVFSRLEREQVNASLKRFGIQTPNDLMRKFYYGNRKLLLEFAQDSRINFDRRPILEYAKVLGEDRSRLNMQELDNVRRRLGAEAVN